MCFSRGATFTELFQLSSFVCCLGRDSSHMACHIDGKRRHRVCGHKNVAETADPRIWVCVLHRQSEHLVLKIWPRVPKIPGTKICILLEAVRVHSVHSSASFSLLSLFH